MSGTLTESTAGLASRPPSVARMFLDRVAASPGREAFRHRVGEQWQSLTWTETKDRVDALAAGLLSLGVSHQQRVAIASSTRIEWVLADLAIMCAGAATTTIYPSTPQEDVAFILADSESQVVVAENAGQLAKVQAVWDRLPDLKYVVLLDPDGETGDRVITFADLETRGRAHLEANPQAVAQASAAVGPEDLATLIYTSGTTGRPKGVRLVHDCWTYEGVAIDALQILNADDLQYLWLPLSHSLGKVLQMMQLTIGFSTAVDGDLDRIVANLAVIKPTFMGAAPRIFEKVHSTVVTTVEKEGGLKAKIFHWAIGVGVKVSRVKEAGGRPSGLLAVQNAIADRLVFATLRERLGGRIRFFISGSAALSKDIAEFFNGAGMQILEGYGLTETSAATFVNRPTHYRFGTVGLPMPGTEVKIADDGEILVRGPGVMRGYHQLPEQTAEAFTEDGWFRTGDIGELDEDFLRITDRKKDLIKTSGGKYVAPQAIEVLFAATCPYASYIVVHGERRNFVSALVTLDRDAMAGWAQTHGMAGRPYEEVVATPEVREMVQGYVDELNTKLARWETIKKFTILPTELSVEEGDLTPSMKIKRKTVEKKYMDVLDSMYG